MRLIEFLANSEGPDSVSAPSDEKKYFSPREALTPSQWKTISSDLDFHTYVQHPGQAGTILVSPDKKFHNTFKIASTANIRNFMKFHVSKRGQVFSKTVFVKGEAHEGQQTWEVVKHKEFT